MKFATLVRCTPFARTCYWLLNSHNFLHKLAASDSILILCYNCLLSFNGWLFSFLVDSLLLLQKSTCLMLMLFYCWRNRSSMVLRCWASLLVRQKKMYETYLLMLSKTRGPLVRKILFSLTVCLCVLFLRHILIGHSCFFSQVMLVSCMSLFLMKLMLFVRYTTSNLEEMNFANLKL